MSRTTPFSHSYRCVKSILTNTCDKKAGDHWVATSPAQAVRRILLQSAAKIVSIRSCGVRDVRWKITSDCPCIAFRCVRVVIHFSAFANRTAAALDRIIFREDEPQVVGLASPVGSSLWPSLSVPSRVSRILHRAGHKRHPPAGR